MTNQIASASLILDLIAYSTLLTPYYGTDFRIKLI